MFGSDGLLPCDGLACVSGHASHNPEHRAVRHPRAVIHRLAAADARKELVVFVLVHVARFLRVKFPILFAFDDVWAREGADDLRDSV